MLSNTSESHHHCVHYIVQGQPGPGHLSLTFTLSDVICSQCVMAELDCPVHSKSFTLQTVPKLDYGYSEDYPAHFPYQQECFQRCDPTTTHP